MLKRCVCLLLVISASAAAETGVSGVVLDARTGEPLIEAGVKALSAGGVEVRTDVDGRFVLPLPEGLHELRVYYELYSSRRLTGVQVRAGQTTPVTVKLDSDEGAVQVVEVEVKADRRSERSLLAERRKATEVSDAVSSQEIARTPDSSAADAVKRVVSATVVGGKYVLLRGLGGRYAQTLLNGALLPSPEPDEPSVPLDLFPSSLLANMQVVKSYAPELPGTFGGGALLIETQSYPERFELKPRISTAVNSESTFRTRLTHRGGSGIPAAVPEDGPAYRLGDERMAEIGRSFENAWSPNSTRSLPSINAGVSMGDTLQLEGKTLGYLAMVGFNRAESVQLAEVGDASLGAANALGYEERGVVTTGGSTEWLSGLLNLGYRLDSASEVSLLSLYTRGEESATQRIAGFDQSASEDFEGTRLQLVSRALLFNQVRGFHRLRDAGDLELRWQANLSRVDRSEPDTRDVTYFVDPDGARRFKNQPASGARFFSQLGETSGGGSLGAQLPLGALTLRSGLSGQLSRRAFEARRFRFHLADTEEGAQLIPLPTEELFAPEHLGSGVRFEERTLLNDSYQGVLALWGAYLNAEVKLSEALRLVAGARYEGSRQGVSGRSPFDITSARPLEARRTSHELLPAASLVWSPSPAFNLRGGYSYTLARPSFRELAPFLFYDFARRRAVVGNPQLANTRIHHADLRAEWFFNESDVFAVSAFGKALRAPIERTLFSGGEMITFANAAGATMIGAELEARTSLGRISRPLDAVKLGANLTLSRSQVTLDQEARRAATRASRPMQGQSPYVANFSLGYAHPGGAWEITSLYNVAGPRISEVGLQGNPDIVELPFHRLDLVAATSLRSGLQLKASLSNLLDSPLRLDQGGLTSLSYRPGRAFSVQLGWSL
jgi:outer membrane receptor protein involved in Fe transport